MDSASITRLLAAEAPDPSNPHMAEIPLRSEKRDFEGGRSSLLPSTLDDLARLVRREIDLTCYPAKDWLLRHAGPQDAPALDAVIVGAGQAGLAACFALQQKRVSNLVVLDENAEGQEGPWATYARMSTLRTHKDVGGIEFGIPSLSFRAWYEVQHGPYSWLDLYKVPTALWSDYLRWYRKVLALPVRNSCRLVGFGPVSDDLLQVDIETPSGRERLLTRTLVLATGIEGHGGRSVPAFAASLPKRFWNHSHEAIDFAALANKTVAVLGGGASAFDNAIRAADQGAARVHLYHRQKTLTSINPGTWAEFTGYLGHFADLPPDDRWRFTRQIGAIKGGPPRSTLARLSTLTNLQRHDGVAWTAVAVDGDQILIDATDGPLSVDHIIFGTGYRLDPACRTELSDHLPSIMPWRDAFTPPDDDKDNPLLEAPFLGSHFEMQEKQPGMAPWLKRVFNFSRGAQASMGIMPIGLSGIKFGIPRLADGVTRRLFVDDKDAYLDHLRGWQASDLSVIDT